MNTIPFIPDYNYKRSNLQNVYVGIKQSRIIPCAKFPYIFIFSGSTVEQYGNEERWDIENVFSYTGAGQVGNMKFDSGNKALREHLQSGKRVAFELIPEIDTVQKPKKKAKNLKEGDRIIFKW